MSRVEPGQTFGAWTVLGIEQPLGRRATCRCVCGNIRQVSVEALEGGIARSCGCSGEFRSGKPARAGEANFASGVAEVERHGAGKRHKGGGQA